MTGCPSSLASVSAPPFPWRFVISLSLTVMTAFGIMLYGFSVFLTDGAAGGDFSTGLLSVAYGGGVIAAGLLAFPVGRRADRSGVRGLLGTGTMLGAAGLGLFSLATRPWHVLGAWWLLIGPAGAMTYYEVAFIAVDRWCAPRHRPRALALLTLIGGLAGIIFLPGVERLVAAVGWRAGVRVLGLLLLLIGGVTASLALRNEPGSSVSGVPAPAFSARELLRDPRFVVFTSGMVLSFAAAQAILSHRVARFEEAGFAVASVALWAALASALSLPGRSIAPFLAERVSPTRVQGLAVLGMAAAVVLMVGGRAEWEMVGHFSLFGLAFGAVLPLRAMVMSGWYSGAKFGRTMGIQWTAASLLGALGPALVGVIHDATGGYRLPVALVAGVLVLAAGLILISGRLSVGADH